MAAGRLPLPRKRPNWFSEFFFKASKTRQSTVKQPKAVEGKAVKGTWNKWTVREWPVGLCRESPFTALPSEAIFAVTDDFLY